MSLEQIEKESSLDEGVFGDHLRRILVLISQDAEVLAGLRAFLSSRAPLSDPVFYRMRSAGLMLGDTSSTAEFRCSLYEGYLRRHLLG